MEGAEGNACPLVKPFRSASAGSAAGILVEAVAEVVLVHIEVAYGWAVAVEDHTQS